MEAVYHTVVAALSQRSVQTYFQSANQLVVSRQSMPAWPFAGNSFWISHRSGQWYLCTWSPIGYRVPEGVDLVDLCAIFVDRGQRAQSKVPVDLIDNFRLVELTEREFTELFGWEEEQI